MPRIKFGDLFLRAKLIDELQLRGALAHQKTWGGRLGDALVELGFVDEMLVYQALSHQLDLPLVSLVDMPVDSSLLSSLPLELAEKHAAFPVKAEPTRLTLALADPTDDDTIDAVAFATGRAIDAVVAPAREIHWAIGHHYRGASTPCPPPRMKVAASNQRFELVGRGGVPLEPAARTPERKKKSARDVPQTGAPGMGAPAAYGAPSAAPPVAPMQLAAMLEHNDHFLNHVIETCIQRGVFSRSEFEAKLRGPL